MGGSKGVVAESYCLTLWQNIGFVDGVAGRGGEWMTKWT